MRIKFLFLFLSFVAGAQASYPMKPKLIVVIIFDQLRADFLTKNKDHFRPASAKGFRFLMDEGSYAPMATYPTLQNLTCPGHAMISTGASPSRNKIILNEWWDPATSKMIYCTQDDQFGTSPARLKSPCYRF